MARFDRRKLKLIHKLLEQTTTLEAVSEFLKKKGATYSCQNWEMVLEKRFVPALEERRITLDELIELLRKSEEKGRQHVFLFQCRENIDLILNPNRIDQVLRSMNIDALIEAPLILDEPAQATIADVRVKRRGGAIESILIKIIETKISEDMVDEKRKGKGRIVREFVEVKARAVTIVEIWADGTLQIRVGARSNASKYREDVIRIRAMLNPIFPSDSFGEKSIMTVKKALWTRRAELQDVVRFRELSVRNVNGTKQKITTSNDKNDLSADESAASSLTMFASSEDSFCEGGNIWFKQQESGVPAKDVHVLLGGGVNEFVVTQYFGDDDYEYVLGKLLAFNE